MGFFGFVGKYWWWLILVSVSYFTYWYFQGYEEKVYQYLRTFLLIGNGYLFLHLFFRPLLTIEPALFLLLGVIVGLMWYVSKLHMKYKRPFYVVGSCISFLILISGLFYLYPEKPDIEGFIRQQQIQLLLHSPMTQPQRIAYLKLTNL
ncbi:MAG: hypothetical protein LBU27_03120 [Candidatus Peribacteria bacterium]|nr:hypothetical protein [Candidatus Peribacteria bacterium]